MLATESVVIERRFQGIPNVALGGYVGGLLAGELPAGEVALRRPVPLERALRVERRDDDRTFLFDRDEKLAEAGPARLSLEISSPPITFEEAAAAQTRSLQRSTTYVHPFPGCLVCGSGRAEGDGLRLFAGPVVGRNVVAAPWIPQPAHAGADGAVRPALVWAALDCPTIMALVFGSPPDSEERVVTARLAVARGGAVRAGAPHVVMAWDAGRDGRARIAKGAILSESGAVLAVGRHALVSTDWGVPLGLDRWRRES